MRLVSRLFPALLRGSLRGEGASAHHNANIMSKIVIPLQRRSSWSSWSSSSSSRWRPPLLLDASSRFFGATAASAPSSTSTSSTSAPAEPPPRKSRGGPREPNSWRIPSSSGTRTTKTKTKKNKLDSLVLNAISHTQRNSVTRALALLEDPPPHIPLEQLTLAGNSLISALGRCGRPHDALRALRRLAEIGAPFDAYTAAAAVSACSKAASMVGTLPRSWAERGRAIYRGYVEAAESDARAAVAAEEAAEAAEAEEEEEKQASGRGGKATSAAETGEEKKKAAETGEEKKKAALTRKGQPIRTRPLLRALLDCGSRSMDPEAVWAALVEYDLAGIRPGPSELASLIHAHARRRRTRRNKGESSEISENGGGGGSGSESAQLRGGSAAKARAAAREFLERYGDRWDPNFDDSRSLQEEDEGEEKSRSSAGEEEGGSSGEEAKPAKRRKTKKKASSSPSPTISMMTPAVYNALLRAHARAGDLDGAYAVRRAMISSRVAPDSGTCRALSECFGEANIELAADLVEAADAERVEFMLSSSSSVGIGASSCSSSSSSSSPAAASSAAVSSSWSSSPFSVSNSSGGGGDASSLTYRPRETLPFPPALLPPRRLKQREWSLFPVLEADDAAFLACQGVERRGGEEGGGGGGQAESATTATASSSSSPLPSLPAPLVLDLHGMSRPAARVVLLVSLRRVVAAAAEPGKRGGSGVWGRPPKGRTGGGGGEGGGVPGGLVLIVGRSVLGVGGRGAGREAKARRRRRTRGSGGSDGASGGGDDDEEEEISAAAAARAASRSDRPAAEGGINAVLSFATVHLGLRASLDPRNRGRVVVTAEDLDSWVLAELERQRRGATAELAGKQAAAVAVVASSAVGFWWVVPKLLAI